MPLACTGINHRTAPVALRERLALGLDAQRELLHAPAIRALGSTAGVRELVILSTCNRTELYAAPDNADASPAELSWPLLHLLAAISDLPLPTLRPHVYDNSGLAAVRHLCRVAAGLDSMVVGESEVLGQVAAAFTTAAGEGAAGPVLEAAFRAAIRAGRRARTETGIGRRPASVSSEAIRLLTEVAGDPERLAVLIVGTGKMGRLAGHALRASGVRTLSVVSRTAAHAEAVAGEWGATALGWHDLAAAVRAADAILCSTGAPHAVVTRELVERAIGPGGDGRRRVFVDIAVPRDVEPEVNELDGAYLYDIDDLEKIVAANLADRAKAAEQAVKIVEHEAGQFEHWMRSQGVVPTIRALREKFAAVADAELQKTLDAMSRKEHSPVQQREAIQRLVQLVVNKLLHQPTAALREAPPDEAELRAQVLCDLFGLEPEEAREADARPPESVAESSSPERSSPQ
jgi:glutamyl-tRNA reductase